MAITYMSEQLKKDEASESGSATKVSLLTKMRRIFGAVIVFAGGGLAYVGAEGNNMPVTAEGVGIMLVGALLAGIGWIRGEKK